MGRTRKRGCLRRACRCVQEESRRENVRLSAGWQASDQEEHSHTHSRWGVTTVVMKNWVPVNKQGASAAPSQCEEQSCRSFASSFLLT